ncbi:hypothetical protein [Tsukamurella sp. 1534]|uniref:hypothetical protein n=1 Tax=Tsukamurella sp. 1534 TaxID=1151061 RepID=UPI0002F935A5|nr:hypothetical protein [Tsukamurella sp. 1534]
MHTRVRVAAGENSAMTYRRLRALIGWVGLSLPAVLLVAGVLDGHVQQSLSAYYYTDVGPYFTGTVCVIGVFLLAYRFGDAAVENVVTTVAGLAALGVAFFHAAPPDPTPTESVLAAVHLTCAGVLFALLGAIAVFLFPSDVPPSKAWQARLYRALGFTIWAAIVAMVALNALVPEFYRRTNLFFWLESVCVIAFAVSFVLKGYLRCPPSGPCDEPGA